VKNPLKLLSISLGLAAAVSGSAYANQELAGLSADPNNWAMQAGDFSNHRYSELKQINAGNVANLTLTTRAVGWTYALESSDDFSNWSLVKTLVIPATGKAMTTDNASAPGQKFYRARLLR